MGRATVDGPPAPLGDRIVPRLRRRRGWLLAVLVIAMVAGFLVGLIHEGAAPERPLAPDAAPRDGILAGQPSGATWKGVHPGTRPV
jgi:hypothetical protein